MCVFVCVTSDNGAAHSQTRANKPIYTYLLNTRSVLVCVFVYALRVSVSAHHRHYTKEYLVIIVITPLIKKHISQQQPQPVARSNHQTTSVCFSSYDRHNTQPHRNLSTRPTPPVRPPPPIGQVLRVRFLYELVCMCVGVFRGALNKKSRQQQPPLFL